MTPPMPPDPTRDDLAFLRKVSEEGRYAPLVGGRYLVMWGTVITVAYLLQYGILSGVFGWPAWTLGAMWVCVMAVASGFMAAFPKALKRKPGEGSVGQRVEREVWTAIGFGIFAYATGTIAATAIGSAPPILFDLIVAMALAGYGGGFLVVAALAGRAWMRIFAAISFTGAAIIPFVAGSPVTYAVGAVFVFAVAVVPGVILLRAEPAPLAEEA